MNESNCTLRCVNQQIQDFTEAIVFIRTTRHRLIDDRLAKSATEFGPGKKLNPRPESKKNNEGNRINNHLFSKVIFNVQCYDKHKRKINTTCNHQHTER
jgi:hypothetical protein